MKIKQNMTLFIHSQKRKQLLMKLYDDVDDVFESIYTTVISNIQISIIKGSGLITDSVIDHNITISKYNPLAGRSYLNFPIEFTIQEKN